VQSERRAKRLQDFVDLHGEFSRWQQHQSPWVEPAAIFGLEGLTGGDSLEHREAEPQRLA
jgi:hypothetical protein